MFRPVSGTNVGRGRLDTLTLNDDKRKNVQIDLRKRRKASTNVPSAPAKYSVNAHPLFELAQEALPEGTPGHILEQAKRVFSCSITRQSQQNYATAVRHLADAECSLGDTFNIGHV